MKHCKKHHKKYHCKNDKDLHIGSSSILNRVASLLLTGIEMAIFGKLASVSSETVTNKNSNISSSNNMSSNQRSNKRKKCGNCNGRDCATCIKI